MVFIVLFAIGISSVTTSMQGVNHSAFGAFRCLQKKNSLQKNPYRDSKSPVVSVSKGGQGGKAYSLACVKVACSAES